MTQNGNEANPLFQSAVAFVAQTSRHLFLTGKAGTGKTTFLRYVQEHCAKKMAVLAPTGVAAINAGGVTLHSFFQLPLGTFLPTQRTVWGSEQQYVYNKPQLLDKLRLNSEKRKLIEELELLVIDEISMVRADTMDAIDTILQFVRGKNEPFGGLQLLLIGDLFQLPPVVKNQEWGLMSEYYEGPYFFDALSIQKSSLVYLELQKIYRQNDPYFIGLLNDIRNNECQPSDLELLHERYDPYFRPGMDEGYITLCSHNYKADAINQEELARLSSRSYAIEAIVTNEFPDHILPVEKVLSLKVGAQIMFIKNDKGEARRYYNGKIGKIEAIEAGGDKIHVSFPEGGAELVLERETWRNIRYRYNHDRDEVEEEELGSFQQYPIRLAWAVTIHKSQGLTFEKAIIDAGQSFAPGQVYVALSRLKGMSGLVLKSAIAPASIRTDERIVEYVRKSALGQDELQAEWEQARSEYIHLSICEVFDWSRHLSSWREMSKDFLKKNATLPSGLPVFLSEVLESLYDQEKTALAFVRQLQDIFAGPTVDYAFARERSIAAIAWFVKEIDGHVIERINGFIDTEKLRGKAKRLVQAFDVQSQMMDRKKKQMGLALQLLSALARNEAQETVNGLLTALKAPIALEPQQVEKPVALGQSQRSSLELFRQGKDVAAIANERGLAPSTIEGHLIGFLSTGEVTIAELVPAHKLPVLMAALQEMPQAKLGELKEKLGSGYSYADIKAALAVSRGKPDETS